jgi:hypothetical protein
LPDANASIGSVAADDRGIQEKAIGVFFGTK